MKIIGYKIVLVLSDIEEKLLHFQIGLRTVYE